MYLAGCLPYYIPRFLERLEYQQQPLPKDYQCATASSCST
jgi:hypothetical protein